MKINIKKILSSKILLFLPIFLIIMSLIAFNFYYYRKYQIIKDNPEIIAQEEIKSVTTVIGNFMELPSDEEPTLATVTDQEKLQGQDFFKNAQNGDKVLIYTRAKKAILYRPAINKIIDFAPLVIGPQDGVDAQSQQKEPSTVVIYNGTNTGGLTNDYEEKLAQINNLLVIEKTTAAKNDYTQAFVIDISGNNAELVQKIKQTVDGEILDSVPVGEAIPSADILVIAGKLL